MRWTEECKEKREEWGRKGQTQSNIWIEWVLTEFLPWVLTFGACCEYILLYSTRRWITTVLLCLWTTLKWAYTLPFGHRNEDNEPEYSSSLTCEYRLCVNQHIHQGVGLVQGRLPRFANSSICLLNPTDRQSEARAMIHNRSEVLIEMSSIGFAYRLIFGLILILNSCVSIPRFGRTSYQQIIRSIVSIDCIILLWKRYNLTR